MRFLSRWIENIKYLGLSLILHLAMLAWIWPRFDKQTQSSPDIIEFEILPPVSTGKSVSEAESKPGGGSRAAKGKLAQRGLVHKILSDHYSSDGSFASGKGPRRQREGTWDEGGYTKDDDPNVAWGAGGGTFERIQDFTLMNHFHAKVDGLLFFPAVLSRHKVSGFVNTRVVLNRDGNCDWHLTKINAADPHLRIYILHLLKKVCDESFKPYMGGRINTNIDMTFQFSISEEPTTEELIKKNQKILGNVLFFFRNDHQSVAEWHLGPFTGLFPIPMVNLDFDWFAENFDKYINHKDAMDEYR